ncbi:MAG: hypothetical protein ACFCUH_08305 [Flavobacteriales bacterium]
MPDHPHTPLPEAFVARIWRDFPEAAATLIEALDGDVHKAVNLNRRKLRTRTGDEPIAWNRYGRFATGDFYPAHDPHWHSGAYYVMEAASQVLDTVVSSIVDRAALTTVLDLSAAPGGKTSVLLNALNDGTVLVSNEIHRGRAQILYENAVKQGRQNHVVSAAAPAAFNALGAQFDLVVVDAPCSGEGMFRKDYGARTEWSEANVAACAVRQTEILTEIAPCVREGGYLVYSTCTFAALENDAQIAGLLASGGWESDTPDLTCFGARACRYGMQFMPGFSPTEGLYIAVLRKTGSADTLQRKLKPVFASVKALPDALPAELPDSGNLVNEGLRYWCMTDEVLEMANRLRNHRIPLLKAGIAIGELKGKQLVPDHEAALYADAVCHAHCDFDLDGALNYLRGEGGRGSVPKGWLAARYEGAVLGWMKGLGDRWNNAYPKTWRLRH